MRKIIFNIYLIYLKFKINKFQKIEKKIKNLLVNKATNLAIKQFPDKKIAEHINFAVNYVTEKLYGVTSELDNEEEYLNFCEETNNNDFIKIYTANFYLVKSYFYENLPTNLAKEYEEQKNQNLDKAKEFDPTSTPLTDNNYKKVIKDIEKEDKNIDLEINEIKKNIIDKKLYENIEPIQLTNSDITFVVSLMSSFFLIGGFIYTYFLLNHFNVKISDYYMITDYLANSIDVIAYVFIPTVVGVFFYFLGMNEAIKKDIIYSELGLDNEPKVNNLYIVFILLIVYSITQYFLLEKIDYISIQIIFFIVIWTVINKLPIWDYIANTKKVSFLLISILLFFSSVIVQSQLKIQKIENGEYKSNYVMSFTNEYKKFETMELLTINSNYLFLLDDTKRQVVILPKKAIVSIAIKND